MLYRIPTLFPLNSFQLPAASHQGGFFVVAINGEMKMSYVENTLSKDEEIKEVVKNH